MNANLLLQLRKTQEANSELIFAVRDFEKLLEQKNREKSCTHEDSQEMEHKNQLSHSRNFDVKQESETTTDHEEEQCELDILVKEHDDIRVAYSQEQKILT